MSTDNIKTDDLAVDPGKAEPIGVQRLRLARERAAALRAAQPVGDAPDHQVKIGDYVHALGPINLARNTSIWGGTPPLSLKRGDTFTVTAELLSADVNKHGHPVWSAIVDDEDAQFAKWGKRLLAPGEFPANLQPWIPGDADWKQARDAAREAAFRQPTEEAQHAALAEVNKTYGPPR
ncbi:hypothetical protein DEU35_3045 [Microbacterium sp. AG157]|uniref:hypothetical protein n=1 Tax=Microbacterium sp. AG157 TaxID=2183993 RepID=UPI000E23BFBF|nr:hypothetical protein [Microbacterium sp. AG157]REC97280.1 hypothetical protein DEU35_3045 [Microbacterium sp. AG157]